MMIKNTLKPIAVAVAALVAASAVHAGETITLENGVNIDWRLTTNYTLSKRVKSADPLLANSAAGNDGNNNFSKNALTANRVSALFESKVSKGETGFVLSASTFYDDVYHRANDNPGLLVSKPAPVNQFTAEAKRFHGGYSRILDAYAYTSFGVGDSSRATVRLGRQAVNWGESVFFPNIAQAQGPFDGTKTGVPGTETKDVILPEDQIVASIEVTPRWTLLGQVQYGFHPTIAPAPGSFLSTSDGVGPGGTCIGIYFGPVCGGFSRGADIRPDDAGQWGIGTRYRATDQTELGLYYLNYNDRTPMVVLQPAPPTFRTGTYQIRYFDDAKLLGATASTTFGNTSAYTEITHRKGVPLLMGALAAPVRADATQINIGSFTNLGRSAISDSAVLLAEVVAVKYSGYDGPKSGLTFKTDSGVAFSTTVALGWPGVFEGWDLNVPISYSQQLNGRTLLGGVGGKGDKRYSIGASFTRRGNLSIGVTYLGYAGGASLDATENRLVADRDQLSLNMKYSF